MERKAFRQRMQQYKQARENNPQLKYWDWKKENDLGYQLYKNNLPSNLQVETDDYDLYGAYESNMQPELNEDGTYHLGSRDPYTGRILKSKQHPTYQKAIESEISAGYFPYEKNNITYTKTYSPVDISGYADGGEVKDNTYVAPVYKEQVFIPATGAQKIKNDYQYKYGSKSPYKGGELEIISPEFDILTGITTLKPIVTKAIRDRARMAVYNNVAPGSYKKSYIAGASKRHEVFNAAKDFLKPGKLEENPKWRKSFQDSSWWEGFGYGNDAKIAEEIREESWKRYLGIKHTPKYYVDNLDGTVSYNLKNIPLKHQQNFVDEVPRGGKVVTGDQVMYLQVLQQKMAMIQLLLKMFGICSLFRMQIELLYYLANFAIKYRTLKYNRMVIKRQCIIIGYQNGLKILKLVMSLEKVLLLIKLLLKQFS